MSSSALLVAFCILAHLAFTTAVQQKPAQLPQPSNLYSIYPVTDLCGLFASQPQVQDGFLGQFEDVVLFSSSTPIQAFVFEEAVRIHTVGAYSTNSEYCVVQQQFYDTPTSESWRENLQNTLPSGIKLINPLQTGGLVVGRIELSQDAEVLNSLTSNPSTIVSRLIPLKVACNAKDYSQEFKELAKEDPNPYYQELVDQVNEDDLRSFVTYLSGEAEGSPILSRNSVAEGAIVASQWIRKQFDNFGFKTTTQFFKDGYSENVVAIWPGDFDNNTEVVVIGAHYDDRAATLISPTERAPGANDDGSGTSALLQIAKIIATNKVRFLRTIHIVAFSGEEQGTLGSIAYANKLVEDKAEVVGMLQADMIAYQKPGSPPLLGFPLDYTTPELSDLAIQAANTYAPGTSTGRNNRCCSDHRSFFRAGFAATDFSDTHGPIQDPAYHSAGDLADRVGYSFDQLSWNAKAMFATLLTLARPATPASP